MVNALRDKTFDVFLSHNSVDKPWAIRLKEALETRGFKVWLDRDEIRPGDLFVDALESGLEDSQAVALLVSPEAIQSGWVREEYSRALSLAQHKNQPLQLIPVVIRETDLPGFLASRHRVDFRDGADFDQSLSQLIFGITGKKDNVARDISGQGQTTPDFERYIGGETAYRVHQLVRDYTKLFVGRHKELQQLDAFIDQRPSGRVVVTARAGFGKTAFVANWISRQQNRGCFIAYHFFNYLYKDATCPLVRALRNLLRQLYIYYKVSDLRLPDNEQSLRDAINGIICERGASNGPLILVLDGLDEAEHPFTPPLPSPLPEGVYAIASARAEVGETQEYLQGWREGAETLHLSSLSTFATKNWAERVGGGALLAFTDNNDFITQLNEKTEGFPLYLHFLLGELTESVSQGRDIWEVIKQTPPEFGMYVKKQFGLLAQVRGVRGDTKIQELFAVLAVAKGPLTSEEVQDLTGLNAWDLNDLPWQATRWFTTFEQFDTSTYIFTNTLLADEFKRALRRQALDAQTRLIDYCARWREHKSPYSLQYYADHLSDVRSWDQLFQVARDAKFREMQSEVYPDTPDLPLRTLRIALQGGLEADRGKEIAEFVLAHVRLVAKVATFETPFDAFKAGNIPKAIRLTDNYDDPVPVLWNLLLIWLLHRNGNTDEANRIFRGLTTIRRARLTGWTADVAATLLSFLDDFPAQRLLTVARRLLGYFHLRILVLSLVRRGTINALLVAEQIIPLISVERERQKARMLIATGFAKLGLWEEAVHHIQLMGDAWNRAWLISDLSSIALQQKDGRRAEELLWELEILKDEIDRDDGRLDLNWQIAKTLADLIVFYSGDDYGRASSILPRIKEIAEKTFRATFKSRVLAELAKAHALLMQVGVAEAFFKEALKVADRIYQPREKARSFAYIGRAYSKAGMRDRALGVFAKTASITRRIPEQLARAEVFEELAKDYVYEGETDTAITVTYEISNRALRTKAQAELTKVLVQKGEIKTAHDYATNKPEWMAAWLLSEIGITLISQGLVTEAIDAWVQAFSERRIVHGENPSLPVIQALADLSRAHYDSGDHDTAEECIKRAVERSAQTRDPKKRIWHAIDIVRTLGSEHSTDLSRTVLSRAYSVTHDLRNATTKVWLLSHIAATAFKLDQITLAEKIFDEAAKVAEEIDDIQEKVKALCRLGEALGWAGKVDLAHTFLANAQELATSNIGLWNVRISALAHIALAYAKSGLIDEARILTRDSDVFKRQDGRKALALVYSALGHTGAAIREARLVGNTKGQAQALRYVAVSEVAHGRPHEALHIVELLISTRDTEFHPVEIPRISRAIMMSGNLGCFKKLVPPHAYRTGAAYRMVGMLGRLYTNQVKEIGELFMEMLESSPFVQQDELHITTSLADNIEGD